ncbi:glycoside hydrolase family 31 protein [Phenylobacterium montanum]|uniref:Glycoside hydrolase family 31 protein n=1 Tax=Phenylobacterium montanum TaxID=2823693 RepID=A0A975FZK5_9CAUL|nr:glycoside hydrolase family 31 protein [Caulobacter sp. S6]QUD87236.1 glycoside hydrolase family 31 protein [Caulobacter sp. S6]
MSSIAHPPIFALTDRAPGRLTLQSADGHIAHVFVLEHDILRVLALPEGRLDQPRTWAIAPGLDDVPAEGRDRFDLSGFSLPAFEVAESEGRLTLTTAKVRLTVRMTGLLCAWEIRRGGDWVLAARDRPTQAHNWGWWDEKVYHYLRREPGERYFGLGERSGKMDRSGRRLRLCNVDAMGYDARTSDPLYKHLPVYITARPEEQLAFGLLYDTLSDCTFDFGQERDNYHGLYRSFVADRGDLDYWFVAGPEVAQVVRHLTWLTGRPAFPPRWSLGYSGSTMAYTDAPDAQDQMARFLEKCAEHDILCESFHLSSGYTSIGHRRHVFHWNLDKFPDPEGFAKSYTDKGVRLVPNIKPCLLADNPRFAEAKAAGLLISEADGEPAWVQFWDGPGAYLDFTNPATAAWWRARVRESLLDKGLGSTWNDNNEFEIWSPKALAHGFGEARPARELKPLQTLLMMRASRDAQVEQSPDKRPYLVSRSGGLGMHRYVQTWSGDNHTSWETLRYNIKMGLGLALSGVSNIGHDVGGFSGPKPDAELFVRWVQFGIFMPRFSIHSWNDDQTANEPWMHPEVTETIAGLIKLRAWLTPYLYDLVWRYRQDFQPIVRPTFLDFPEDPNCWREGDDFLLGGSLLVAPVVEPGVSEREVYLPAGTSWYDLWTGKAFEGGQAVRRPADWARPIAFAAEGAVIPVNIAEQHFARPADERAVLVCPTLGEGAFSGCVFEDDGETAPVRDQSWSIDVACGERQIRVRLEVLAGSDPPKVILPQGERRPVQVEIIEKS